MVGRSCIVAAVIGCAGSTGLATTVIDFESLSDLEVVDNQFFALGADFNGTATALVAGGSLNATFPPFSGSGVIYNPSGLIRVDAVGGEWGSVGGYITGNAAITMTAFDSNGVALGSVATPGANYIGNPGGLPQNIFLSLSYPNIAYVELSDGGNAFTIDDFQFDFSTIIPLPSASALAGVGLIGLGARRRRTNI